MSGGAFDYNQHKIRYIQESIQEELDKQGKERPVDRFDFYDKEYYEKYPEEKYYHTYREDV